MRRRVSMGKRKAPLPSCSKERCVAPVRSDHKLECALSALDKRGGMQQD